MNTKTRCSRLDRQFAVWLGLIVGLLPTSGATPSSGTVSQSSPTVTWAGQIPIPPAAGSSRCSGPNNPGCDNFSVTIPVSTTGRYVIQLVNIGVGPVNIWTAATPQVTY